ncbi:hypothetical protein [Paenibacillus sp.]|uniref:hypothetical protein n=1 Tax=Paenibacillus sp. TaxID=58172 RepID=UPI002D659346|nr:hypothetical protein [Paenibacillus sp.]HZG83722.1 hypothetical protein [Paenibacillus sp.]
MLQRILRSPLVPMFYFLLMTGFLVLSLAGTESESPLIRYSFLLFALLALAWIALIFLHNRNQPRHPVKAWGLIPPELREMDEGQQWITFKACRNVYIYYTVALPLAAGACFVLAGHRIAPLICIGVLGLGQYLVYWLTIRKFNRF